MPAASPTVHGSTAAVAGLSTTSPSSTIIGDLVVVYTGERTGSGIPTHTVDSGNGYVEIISQQLEDGTTDGRLSVAYKIATANGAQSYTAYSSSVGTETWTGCLVVDKDTYDVDTLPPSAGTLGTGNQAPNPPQVTGLTAARFYLVICVAFWRFSSALTNTVTVPSGFDARGDIAGSATADVACATDELTGATSIDPGAWADNQAPTGTCNVTIALLNDATVIIETDGSMPVTATLTGASATVLPANGSVTATATVTGDGEDAAAGPTIVEADGTITATSIVTGAANAIWLSQGAVPATTALEAASTVVLPADGACAATATFTGTSGATAGVDGVVAATTIFTGQGEDAAAGGPTIIETDGSITAAATVTGDGVAIWLTAGDIAALTTAAGLASAIWLGEGTIASSTTVTGLSGATVGVAGAIIGVAALTGSGEDAAAPAGGELAMVWYHHYDL